MKHKKFFLLFVLPLLGAAFSVPAFNYALDYYGVFRGASQKEVVTNQLNDRFVKMEYLLQNGNHVKYDSYLWGSSRVQKMDTQVTGLYTYNMGASAGAPDDCLSELRQLIKNRAKIQVVYLGIDDFVYTVDYKQELSAIYRRPYNESLKGNAKYYAELLSLVGTVKQGTKEWIRGEDRAVTLISNTGAILVPKSVEAKIERDPTVYIKQSKFNYPIQLFDGGTERFEKSLTIIRQIKQLCDENYIQFILFFNPQHMTTYLADDMELMNRFKKELVKISPFWDFSGVNYVTANNYFWYETSHPRAFICDKILDTVSGQNKITWVPDFGVYVTPENVDAFCEKAVRDRQTYDPGHEQWVPTAEERAVMTKRVNYSW